MSNIAFFFFLTLQLHGYGQPIGAGQPLWIWDRASEARETLANRVKRDFPEDDYDYEPYNTPTPELMENDTLTMLSLATVEATQLGATTDLPRSEFMKHGAGTGKLATEGMTPGATEGMTPGASEGVTPGATEGMTPAVTEGMTPGATERGPMNSLLAKESTSGLLSTHDLTTSRVDTDVPEIVVSTTEESTSYAPSPGQQDTYDSTGGAVGTDSVTVSTMGKPATDPVAMVTVALDTDPPKTGSTTMGQLVPESATTREPPTILPTELKSNGSSPASSLNASAFSSITDHAILNFPTTSSPPSSSKARSDPPNPAGVTGQMVLSNSTAPVAVASTAHLFMNGHIPVRQCLLAVLILALIATIFLICTVVLAIRLSKKGHTYPVRDYSPTEMVCISSLMAEGEGPLMANGGPVSAKTELLKPTPDPGEDCDGDELTLHSFLP